MKWTRVGRTVGAEGTTTIYQGDDGWRIESRKRHILHATGIGTWDHTSYWVICDGKELIEKQSLRDAKEWVEEHG